MNQPKTSPQPSVAPGISGRERKMGMGAVLLVLLIVPAPTLAVVATTVPGNGTARATAGFGAMTNVVNWCDENTSTFYSSFLQRRQQGLQSLYHWTEPVPLASGNVSGPCEPKVVSGRSIYPSSSSMAASYYGGGDGKLHFFNGNQRNNATSWFWTPPDEADALAVNSPFHDFSYFGATALPYNLLVSTFHCEGGLGFRSGLQSLYGNSTAWSEVEQIPGTADAQGFFQAKPMESSENFHLGLAYYVGSNTINYTTGMLGKNGTSVGQNGTSPIGNGTAYSFENWLESPITLASSSQEIPFAMETFNHTGWPVVAYYDEGDQKLLLRTASDIHGTNWNEAEAVRSTPAKISNLSMARNYVNSRLGLGIAYYDHGLKDLMYIHGTPPPSGNNTGWGTGFNWSEPVRVVEGGKSRSASTVYSSLPLVLHSNEDDGSLYYSNSYDGLFSGIDQRSGDINADGQIDLADAILPLQITTSADVTLVVSKENELRQMIALTVDGNDDDWHNIPQLMADAVADTSISGIPGTDLASLALARSGDSLYIGLTLANGLPAEGTSYRASFKIWSANYFLLIEKVDGRWQTFFGYNIPDGIWASGPAAVSENFVEASFPWPTFIPVYDPIEIGPWMAINGGSFVDIMDDPTHGTSYTTPIINLPATRGDGKIGLEETINALRTVSE